jgi:hypothetical protein
MGTINKWAFMSGQSIDAIIDEVKSGLIAESCYAARCSGLCGAPRLPVLVC